MITLFAALCVGAPPAAPVLQVVLPDPAEALPRLKPVLTWAAYGVPPLAPRRVQQTLAPLGLDPFSAPPEAWVAAGLSPHQPAELTQTPRGATYVRLAVKDPKALAAYLTAQPSVHPVVGPEPGFVAGPAGRPSLVGAQTGRQVWLRRHRALLTLPKAEHEAQALRAVQRLRTEVQTLPRPRFEKLDRPPGVTGPPDLRAVGQGPAPVTSWTGALWIQSEQWRGAARLHLEEVAELFVRDWLPSGRAPRRLLAPKGAAIEVLTRVHPPALLALWPRAPTEAARALTGELHGAFTRSGEVVLALALRPGVKDATLEGLAQAMNARDPGVKWRRQAEPQRAIFWYAGRGEGELEAWLTGPVTRRGPRAASLWADPAAVMEALAARDAQAEGPQLGLGRRTALGVMYGAWMAHSPKVSARLIKSRGSIDLYVALGPSTLLE